MGCIVEGKGSASDHTTTHRAENPAPASHTALTELGKDRLPGWQLKKNKQGEPRTKWHTEHFGNPCVPVIFSHAVHKEVVTLSMRWWTYYYYLQGQIWNHSPRQIPGSTHWLKSSFEAFYSLLMQTTHQWSNLQIYIFEKGRKVAYRHCLPASSGLKDKQNLQKIYMVLSEITLVFSNTVIIYWFFSWLLITLSKPWKQQQPNSLFWPFQYGIVLDFGWLQIYTYRYRHQVCNTPGCECANYLKPFQVWGVTFTWEVTIRVWLQRISTWHLPLGQSKIPGLQQVDHHCLCLSTISH